MIADFLDEVLVPVCLAVALLVLTLALVAFSVAMFAEFLP